MAKSGLTKKKSKRLTCRRRYKIDKNIREHKRKVRKNTKEKEKLKSGFRKKPDIQIPNKCPFKEDILKEAQEQKKTTEEAKIKRIEDQKKKRKADRSKLVDKKRSLQSLVKDADDRQKTFQATRSLTVPSKDDDGKNQNLIGTSADVSLKTYYSEVKKVLERSDVILEVLDARDPLGSRCAEVENSIIESGKRLVLLLNKIDLIPKENVKKWLKYLRNEFPTIAFKASTQEQNSNLGRAGHSLASMTSTSKCIGADILMKLFGNYCRNKDIKTSICVGIVGFPNVGKSSVINSLKRKVACNVGATPGVTKAVQEVHLDKKIRLLDSPGVVLASKNCLDPIEMALRNTIRVELLEDPVLPVEGILRRCTKDSLMLQYKIPEYEDIDDFLCLVARKVGRLKKGGIPDRKMAARKVLNDWNAGKIRYYTEPPECSSGVEMVSAELVAQMSKEFDLDSIDNEQKLLVEDLPANIQPDVIVLPSFSEVVSLPQEKMDVDKPSSTKVSAVKKNPKDKMEGWTMIETPEDRLEGNLKLNKKARKNVKKDKKKRRKTDKLATNLSNALDSAMDIGLGDKDYDFDVDFK